MFDRSVFDRSVFDGPVFDRSVIAVSSLGTALRGAGKKLQDSVTQLDVASNWLQRFVAREAERRAAMGAAHWDERYPGLTREQKANRRIRRMLARATLAGMGAAVGASSAEVLSVVSEGAAVPGAIPLGLFSVVGEMLYTTALQIELAVDLASIYEVPFRASNVGELSTLLGLAMGVDLVREPSRHDQPAAEGGTKPWRVQRQMQRSDFSQRVGIAAIQQSVLRNVLPFAGVVVSAAWNQILLRRFARHVHTIVRQRQAIVSALRQVQLADPAGARVVLDGAWLLATADGELGHQEALALATLIDALHLPERIAVDEASFSEDEEAWFTRVRDLDEDARGVLVDVLGLVAGCDGDFTTAERRFFERLGITLGRKLDIGSVERAVASLRVGQAPAKPRASAFRPMPATA